MWVERDIGLFKRFEIAISGRGERLDQYEVIGNCPSDAAIQTWHAHN